MGLPLKDIYWKVEFKVIKILGFYLTKEPT